MQCPSLLLFLFSSALVVCCISANFGGEIDVRFGSISGTHSVHAFVGQNALRRNNMARAVNEIIPTIQTKASVTRAVTLLSVASKHRNRSVCKGSKQQSNDVAEIDNGNIDIPRSTITTLNLSMVIENNTHSARRIFLIAAGATTGLVTTTSVLSPLYTVAPASVRGTKSKDHRVIIDRAAAEAPMARPFEYTENNGTAITIPLAFTGQELLVAYKVDGSKFKAVLDTGSPFLMIPGSCGSNTRQKSGCYQNQGIPIPGLKPTIEIFDGFQGEVNWRSGPFEFWDINNNDSINASVVVESAASLPTPQTQQKQTILTNMVNHDNETKINSVIFGVASEAIMGGPGGVFFGMIRDTDARIRPSFLGQTDVRAFRIDLAKRPRTLTLANQNLIVIDDVSSTTGDISSITESAVTDYIPMTNLLRRRYGDPVGHYTAHARSIYVNSFRLVDTSVDKRSKIFVIFDTGVTGMVVSRGLFDEQYTIARKRREKSLFGNVELTFSTALGKEITLCATKPLTTPFDPDQTWKKFPKRREGKKSTDHIIVMGLAFLEDRMLTVDIDGERILVE